VKIYTVHEPPEQHLEAIEKSDRIEFVKEGFAWLALFFPLLWLIYHQMWLVLAVFAGGVLILTGGLYELGMGEAVINLVSALVSVAFAFEANNLRRWTLERQGYRMIATVSGRSQEDCELKFFSYWSDQDDETSDLERVAGTLSGLATDPATQAKIFPSRLGGNYPAVLGDIKG
jgi:hypothetical protein